MCRDMKLTCMSQPVTRSASTATTHRPYRTSPAFGLGTVGGAEALNLSNVIGTAEEGKRANLVIFDILSTNIAGARDPFQAVGFNASSADFVNGESVKRNGKLVKADWRGVAQDLRAKAAGREARRVVAGILQVARRSSGGFLTHKCDMAVDRAWNPHESIAGCNNYKTHISARVYEPRWMSV